MYLTTAMSVIESVQHRRQLHSSHWMVRYMMIMHTEFWGLFSRNKTEMLFLWVGITCQWFWSFQLLTLLVCPWQPLSKPPSGCWVVSSALWSPPLRSRRLCCPGWDGYLPGGHSRHCSGERWAPSWNSVDWRRWLSEGFSAKATSSAQVEQGGTLKDKIWGKMSTLTLHLSFVLIYLTFEFPI